MTIKKLSLAAILTVGIAASTMTLTMADTMPVVTGAACPLPGCNTPITPDTAPCPGALNTIPEDCGFAAPVEDCGCGCPVDKCECARPDKGCKKKEKRCKKVSKCDKAPKCAEEKPKCECGEPKCRCADKNAPCKTACDKPAVPATASCPGGCSDVLERQVYAYPQWVFGGPNYTGSEANGMGLGYDGLNYAYNGAMYANGAYLNAPVVTGAAAPCGCGCAGTGVPLKGCQTCPEMTGAAANIPIISGNGCGCNCGGGAALNRCENQMNGANCPIEIQSSNSMEALHKSFVPYTIQNNPVTGAAAPLITAFEDIPPGFWAGCDINRLTANNIIAGYPDRTFKPNLPISRAEMAAMITKGLNVDIAQATTDACSCFKDVPKSFWGHKAISEAVTAGLMAGYPDKTFQPNKPVSKTEAMTILAKGINCPMDDCKADSILSQYCDGANVPGWAKIPVAKVLETGALKNSPMPNTISPQRDASRAELASMLQGVRVAIGYDTNDKITMDDCECTGGAAFLEREEIVNVPTLQICFNDEISAKSAQVGDHFAATTTEEITINGCAFPCGSKVYGQVVEVVRPSTKCKGALRMVYNRIESDCNKADLPKQMLSAQVNTEKKPNIIIRTLEAPFALVGGLVGITGRTLGGMVANVGNAIEGTTQGVGVAVGELSRAEFKAAGRSLLDSTKTAVLAPVDFVGTALSGTTGLLQYTGDELMYLVDTKGNRVTAVNPKEKVTIAFGCGAQSACK